jgi:hypothetical protein
MADKRLRQHRTGAELPSPPDATREATLGATLLRF